MSSNNDNIILILIVMLIGVFVYTKQSKVSCDNNSNFEEQEGFCSNSSKRNYTVDMDGDFFSDYSDSSICNYDSERDCHSEKDSDLESLSVSDRRELLELRRIDDRNKQKMACLIDSLRANKRVCDEFLDKQYHKDYNDTITAINNLTPQKELFNMGFLPVKEISPDPGNIKELVRLFIDRINDEVENRVSEYLNPNSGWNDQGKRKKIKSGFEEQMEELGLPGDLYTQPADKEKITLIKIDKAEQHMTDDQIRFIVHIIIQKKNVKDQMVVKILFFMEKEDLKSGGDHRESFFNNSLTKKNNDSVDLNSIVIIEQVFTVGFMSDTGTAKTRMDKFHNYGDVMNQNGVIDQYKVLQIMKKKHADRSKELSSFLCSVDDETKELHDVPGIGDYESYKDTRTIMDDLKINPQRSFGKIPI
jgi:hypothetical protein